jgi:ABC-type multidrug transport system ATPase subunit
MTEPALIFRVQNLEIAYGFKQAVKGVSLDLTAGRCLGLLGVNGAGKTSTIRALLGMLKPRQGSVELFGSQPRKVFFAHRFCS